MIDDIRLFGGGASLWFAEDKEVLCEAGARTGKSFSLLAKAEQVWTQHPQSRQLFLRKVRRTLTTTILPDWEAHFCPPNHPGHTGTAKPGQRDQYLNPSNGATIDILGMDLPAKILSGQWDRIYAFQCEDLDLADWETLLTRLSWAHTPYHQLVADVNPESEGHWLNIRGDQWVCSNIKCGLITERAALPCESCGAYTRKMMKRIGFIHEDNPLLYDHEAKDYTEFGREYMETLNQLSGLRRDRLLLHKWVSAEGLVLEEYDRHIHLVNEIPPMRVNGDPFEGCWFLGAFDWGWRDAACLQIWAIRDDMAWRFREAYFTEKQLDWWVDLILEVHEEFPLSNIIVSHERPDIRELLNQRASYERRQHIERGPDGTEVRIPRKREIPHFAIPAPNGKAAAIDATKFALKPPTGGPKMFFKRDSHVWGIDQDLRKRGKPFSFESEVSSLVWLKEDEGARKPRDREIPDPNCEDHAFDTTSWVAQHVWEHRGIVETHRVQAFKEESFADILGHEEVWNESKRRGY